MDTSWYWPARRTTDRGPDELGVHRALRGRSHTLGHAANFYPESADWTCDRRGRMIAARATDLPTGTVTFLFTDVEGSTKLLHELGAEGYAEALAEHRSIVRERAPLRAGSRSTRREMLSFSPSLSAHGAVAAAQAIAEGLAAGLIRLRIGLHTGTPLRTGDGYVGDDVHLAARVAASGHGGQIVLSRATCELLDGFSVTDLGRASPQGPRGCGRDLPSSAARRFPPLKTISNTNLPRPASSFVGRQRELEDVLSLVESGTRLLTLTGPGGSGKTRLALEAAATLVPSFKAGTSGSDSPRYATPRLWRRRSRRPSGRRTVSQRTSRSEGCSSCSTTWSR